MKYKESNKQKYYMRNVYINQIMKPEIQNNLNYAYFDNSGMIPNYTNNQNIAFNHNNIIFNNKQPNNINTNNYINPKTKKETVSKRKNKNQRYNQNTFVELNDDDIYVNNINKRSYDVRNVFNERNYSENKTNNFNQTQTIFKGKEKINDIISNLKVHQASKYSTIVKKENINNNYIDDIHFFDNKKTKYTINENISSRNINSNNSLKKSNNNKKSFKNDRTKNQNYKEGNNNYFSEINKKEINQINNIISINNTSSTSPNININNNYKINRFSIGEKNMKNSSNNISRKSNQINSYKNVEQFKNPCYKSMDKNTIRNINNQVITNNYKSPQRENDDYVNVDNISSLNSPSIPSYSSIIEDNSVNSKNYVWVKKNIKNNKMYNNVDNNYLGNYYKKPFINQDNNSIQQNLIKLANDITNIDSYLYKTEIIFPNFISKKMRRCEKKELMNHSATIIQANFRGYLIKKKFDICYYNYKYYYHKGLEILELILNYFFKKHINITKEKQRFFRYLISLKDPKITNKNDYRSGKTNKINKKYNSLYNFKNFNSTFSPVIQNGKIISKFYQDLFLHKEIGERFNIIKQDSKEKDVEKKYKEKIDVINIKVNKLSKENNILKDINQKNIIMERKFREMSKENKKKDDIINIITNDNKTLARKLKIIKDKYNKLQIQNQEDINYNSPKGQFEKNDEIDLFEEYRNLFLSLIIHKNHEKYYVSVLKNYLSRWKNISYTLHKYDEINWLLKKQKLQYILKRIDSKEKNILYSNFNKFYYQSILMQKETEVKNNKIKFKLLNIIKNKEQAIKSNLKKYFYRFYYKGIILNKEEEKNKNIINIGKRNYEKIQKLLIILKRNKEISDKKILNEFFIKWHLYTKVISLKALINDKRRKKRQKQKLKKKNENEANNKYLTNNKILHFGKSNIYILNKEKEKELLISLDKNNKKLLSSNEDLNIDFKLNKIIEATNKLGNLFYKAASKYKLSSYEEINNNNIKENNDKGKMSENNDNKNYNEVEEDEDSGDSFGI